MALKLKELSDEKLEAAFREIKSEVMARKNAADEAENSKYIGKCFLSRNCYSCPKKKSDYWNLYSYVIRQSEGTGVDVLQFQVDKFGSVFVQQTQSYVHLLGKKISREQFDKAATKAIMTAAEKLMLSIQLG